MYLASKYKVIDTSMLKVLKIAKKMVKMQIVPEITVDLSNIVYS